MIGNSITIMIMMKHAKVYVILNIHKWIKKNGYVQDIDWIEFNSF